MSDDLRDLVAITNARFQAEQVKLRDILQQEQRLRAKVAELDEQHRAAKAPYLSDGLGQRVYGGDVLWQGWVARTRRQLQIELAQVLAEKGQKISALSKAHGRKLASEALEEAALKGKRADRLRQQVEQEQGLFLLDQWLELPHS